VNRPADGQGAPSAWPGRRDRLLLVGFALLAFACGALAVGWRADHRRVQCYRDFAEEDLVADARCAR
jgi:hypothetical protein